MSHMCIGNLLSSEINKLDSNNLIISIDLLDEFTQLIIFDNSGPIFIKRLASIRNFPTIDEMKEIQVRGVMKILNQVRNFHLIIMLYQS